MESPALPEPPYNGRGSVSSEGPATSSISTSRRPSDQAPHSSPGRQPYAKGSAPGYFQPSFGSSSSHSPARQAEDGQEYLGSINQSNYNQSQSSRQTSYDEPKQSQSQSLSHLDHTYPAHLSHTHSSTSLSTSASATTSTNHYNSDSPHSLQPPAVLAASPDPNSSSFTADHYDEPRGGDGLGLGRIAEPAPPPPAQERRGSAWLPDRHDEEGGIPTNFDESVLRALCESDVSEPRCNLDRSGLRWWR